jgi:hypothetical protein
MKVINQTEISFFTFQMKWWKGKKKYYHKAGTFNLEHYMRVCNARVNRAHDE